MRVLITSLTRAIRASFRVWIHQPQQK